MSDLIIVLTENSLVTAFAVVGLTVAVSYSLSRWLTKGRLHGSAVAVLLGLVMAYFGGVATGGNKGVADIPVLAGMGILGGAMLRDLAIVATAIGVRVEEFKHDGAHRGGQGHRGARDGCRGRPHDDLLRLRA